MATRRERSSNRTPVMVSIGPMPEWRHIGISSLIPNTRLMLVPSQDTDAVSVLDLEKRQVITTVRLEEGSAPWHVKATHDGLYAYASNSRFNGHVDTAPREPSTVSVIDIKAGEVLKEVPVGGGPVMIEMDERRKRAYVTNRFDNTFTVIDTQKHEPVNTVKVGNAPFWIRMTPKEDQLIVGNFEDATLSVIDPDSLEIVNTIPVGDPRLTEPYPEFGAGDTMGFALTSDGVAHVANWRSHSVVSLNIRDAAKDGRRAITRVDRSVRFPFAVEVNEKTGTIVVGSYDVLHSRLVVFDTTQRLARETAGERLGVKIADIPIDGKSVPRGKAAEINYWMSQPFESRIIGFTSEPQIVNPIDLVAAVL